MSSTQLQIRPARAADVREVVGLVNDAYGRSEAEGGWTSEDGILAGPRIQAADVEEMIDDEEGELLVAHVDGEIVGCVHLSPFGEQATELGMLSVDPDLQDEGLGRRILAAGEGHAREQRGARRIVLKVLEIREELLTWYQRRGYERRGRTQRFEPEEPQRSLVGELVFELLEKELG